MLSILYRIALYIIACVILNLPSAICLRAVKGNDMLFFTMDNCPACTTIVPEVSSVKQQGYSILTHKNQFALARQFGVTHYPTILYRVDDGTVVKRSVGYMSARAIVDTFKSLPPSMRINTGRASENQAVVRVICIEGTTRTPLPGGGYEDAVYKGNGSGVFIARTQLANAYIITNHHVVKHAKAGMEIQFLNHPSKFSTPGHFVESNPDWDIALVVCKEPPTDIPTIPLARTRPVTGEFISIAGFGGGDYAIQNGKLEQYCTITPLPNAHGEDLMKCVPVMARQGDSGGPIFNSSGELAGVLHHAGSPEDYEACTIGTCCDRIRTVFRQRLPKWCGQPYSQEPSQPSITRVPPRPVPAPAPQPAPQPIPAPQLPNCRCKFSCRCSNNPCRCNTTPSGDSTPTVPPATNPTPAPNNPNPPKDAGCEEAIAAAKAEAEHLVEQVRTDHQKEIDRLQDLIDDLKNKPCPPATLTPEQLEQITRQVRSNVKGHFYIHVEAVPRTVQSTAKP